MNILLTLKRVWKGACSKKEISLYFIVVYGIYVLGIIVGAAFYPGQFSMVDVYVSYLGGNEKNPDGYIFYNTCLFISGVMMIPIFVVLYKKLRPAIKILDFIASLFGIFGIISFASLGIFHQDILPKAHSLSSTLTFGGFGLSAIFYIPVFIRKSALKQGWPHWWQIVLLYSVTFGLLTWTLLADFAPELFISLNWDPKFVGDRFLEWFYVFTVMSWIIIAIIILPPDKKDNPK
ncbi:MAG: hypothetical protein ACTSYS_08125 [Promethearchaeota archaeon]